MFQPVNSAQSTVRAPLSGPNLALRLEGLVVFIGAILLFWQQGGNGLIFVALLFTPDLSMVGYLANPRLGALTYNAVHMYLLPAFLLLVGVALSNPVLIQLAAIWFAHIGIDRTVGYGLKYASAFKATHLQRV